MLSWVHRQRLSAKYVNIRHCLCFSHPRIPLLLTLADSAAMHHHLLRQQIPACLRFFYLTHFYGTFLFIVSEQAFVRTIARPMVHA